MRALLPAPVLRVAVLGVALALSVVSVLTVVLLAAAALDVLRLPDDRWRAMSQAAFETVRDSSWDRSCDLLERSLMRARERAPSLRRRA